MKEMMNDECGMMNEGQRGFDSSFRIHHSSFAFILPILSIPVYCFCMTHPRGFRSRYCNGVRASVVVQEKVNDSAAVI
jgi:hypothetical protein